jgi:hypothetical protein
MKFVSQEAGACAFDVIEGSWARLVSWIGSGPPQKLGASKSGLRRDDPSYVARGWRGLAHLPIVHEVHSVKRLCCRQYAASRCNPKESAMERSGRHLRQHMECLGMANRNYSW